MALNETGTPPTLDVAAIKADFPILSRRIHDQRLVFLDSAASSQKPRQVLAAMDHYYETTHANVHRAAYTLAEEATNAMEGGRSKVARFVGFEMIASQVVSVWPPITSNMLRCNLKPLVADCDCERMVLNCV